MKIIKILAEILMLPAYIFAGILMGILLCLDDIIKIINGGL